MTSLAFRRPPGPAEDQTVQSQRTHPASLDATGDTGLNPGIPAKLLVVLALLSAVAPIATDLYLASFPQLMSDFGTTASRVQLTLTAFLLGVAVGQLGFGPLSDRFGRLRPLLIGSALCVLASLVTVLAPTVGVLSRPGSCRGSPAPRAW